MSNRSRQQPNRPNPIMDAIKKAADEAKQNDGVPDELPKPNFQYLGDQSIRWVWNAILGKAHVESVYTKRNRSYAVTMYVATPGEDTTLTLSNEESQALGEALLAANQWEHIWPAHVGGYLLDPPVLTQTLTPVDSPANDE